VATQITPPCRDQPMEMEMATNNLLYILSSSSISRWPTSSRELRLFSPLLPLAQLLETRCLTDLARSFLRRDLVLTPLRLNSVCLPVVSNTPNSKAAWSSVPSAELMSLHLSSSSASNLLLKPTSSPPPSTTVTSWARDTRATMMEGQTNPMTMIYSK
jgi:hypothetical protein